MGNKWSNLTMGLAPTQDASHQQDYSIFRIRNPNQNYLHFVTGILGGG